MREQGDNKNTTFIKHYKVQEIVESHSLRGYERKNIEKDNVLFFFTQIFKLKVNADSALSAK